LGGRHEHQRGSFFAAVIGAIIPSPNCIRFSHVQRNYAVFCPAIFSPASVAGHEPLTYAAAQYVYR
jgi:hypothetical protein